MVSNAFDRSINIPTENLFLSIAPAILFNHFKNRERGGQIPTETILMLIQDEEFSYFTYQPFVRCNGREKHERTLTAMEWLDDVVQGEAKSNSLTCFAKPLATDNVFTKLCHDIVGSYVHVIFKCHFIILKYNSYNYDFKRDFNTVKIFTY